MSAVVFWTVTPMLSAFMTVPASVTSVSAMMGMREMDAPVNLGEVSWSVGLHIAVP